MIKVLVVDDSAVARQVLAGELSKLPDIEVVGTAMDAFVARDKILALHPDVVTLDLEMPRMDGLTFLMRLMQHYPLPVIVVSSITPVGGRNALRALEVGAFDVVPKPGPANPLADVVEMLGDRIRAAAVSHRVARAAETNTPPAPADYAEAVAPGGGKLVAIGASTGGPEALRHVLSALPAQTPPVLVVQHMPAAFTGAFASRLNELCLMEVREAADNDEAVPGLVLVAPGDRHMVVRRRDERFFIQLTDGPKVHHQRPAADVLFQSVAQRVGGSAVGVVLTGMGADGARGLAAMRQAGAATIAQDEASCVVFGMPREAIAMGGAGVVAGLHAIPGEILKALSRPGNAAACGAVAGRTRE